MKTKLFCCDSDIIKQRWYRCFAQSLIIDALFTIFYNYLNELCASFIFYLLMRNLIQLQNNYNLVRIFTFVIWFIFGDIFKDNNHLKFCALVFQ